MRSAVAETAWSANGAALDAGRQDPSEHVARHRMVHLAQWPDWRKSDRSDRRMGGEQKAPLSFLGYIYRLMELGENGPKSMLIGEAISRTCAHRLIRNCGRSIGA